MSKKISVLTLVLIGLSMNNLSAKNHILERKVLSNPGFNFIDVHSINLFIDDDNNAFVLIEIWRTDSTKDFLYVDNNWIRVDKYGVFLNGFIKDGQFHLAFLKDGEIVIYKIRKDKDIELVSSIDINSLVKRLRPYYNVDSVIPVQGPGNSYCLLACHSHFPVNPLEFLRDFISAGHGINYSKPYLIEVQDGKLGKPRELRYGGKIDETFLIKETTKGKDSIHFLGFRGAETPETSGPPAFARNKPVILHYADYDLKKKKTVRKHSIYKDTPGSNKNTDTRSYYGSLSIDNLDDDIFVVFSWVVSTGFSTGDDNIKNFKPDVYYWQYSDNCPGDIEKIGNGFMPVIKVDSLGNVYVLWIDHDGNLVCKTKKDDKWSKDNFILTGIDILSGIISTRYVSTEFDKQNNLHVVFPSNGDLVHAKVKLNVMADKQN